MEQSRPAIWVGAVVVATLLALPLSGLGQSTQATSWGLYYKEIRKDDRIYVFNNPGEAARFETSGAMGRSIERSGAGPEGQTVVGDSERALQLFFFKYGLSEAVPDPPPPIQIVEWDDGKTRVTTDKAYLEFSNRVQVRFTEELPDENFVLRGTFLDPGESRGSFRLRRVKTKLDGWIWLPPAPTELPKITYELQFNWTGIRATNLAEFVEDANIAIDTTGHERYRVRFGQFKVPFGHQELTSSTNLSFPDRALVSDEYAPGRETGFAVQGVLANRIEYRAGIFNGGGPTQPVNDNAAFLVAARVMWQPNGNQPMAQPVWVRGALYSEADFESTTTPIYAFALNLLHNDARRTTLGNDLDTRTAGIDGLFKFKGVFATAEFYWRKQTPEVGDAFHSNGGFGEFTFMLNRARTWEVGFRYGLQDGSNQIDNDDVQEIRVVTSYYYRRHALKFQVDGGQVKTGLVGGNGHRVDHEVRAQTQFIF